MKKVIFLLLAAVMLAAAGCSSPMTRTVVLESDTEHTADITVSMANNLIGDDRYEGVSYIGFDERGRLFGMRRSGKLFYWDETFTQCTDMKVEGAVLSADVAALGNYILVETLQSGNCEVLLYHTDDLESPTVIGEYPEVQRTAAPQWKGGAAYACYVTIEPQGYMLNTCGPGNTGTSMRVNENMLSGYRMANMINGYILEDAFYIGSDWFVARVTFNLRTYYAVAELVDGRIADVMILESAGGDAVPTYSGMYYIDKQDTLMFYDAVEGSNRACAEDVLCFDISVGAEYAAYVKREGTMEKLYVMHTDGSGNMLVDINNGIESLDMSEDGSRLLVCYEDAAIPPAVYILEH